MEQKFITEVDCEATFAKSKQRQAHVQQCCELHAVLCISPHSQKAVTARVSEGVHSSLTFSGAEQPSLSVLPSVRRYLNATYL